MRILQRAKNNNGLVSNSFFIFLIRFFPSLAILLVVVFFSRNLSQHEYGSYQNFWVQLYLLGAIAIIGIPAFVLTYSPEFVKSIIQKISSSTYVKIIAWIVLVGAVFSWLRYQDVQLPWYISTGFFIVYSLNAISEAMLIVCRRFGFLLIINGFYTLVFLLLHYWVLIDEHTMGQLFSYLLLLGTTRLIISAIAARYHLSTISGSGSEQYTMADIRSLWRHIGIYDAFNRFITWIDKFAVSLIFTASVSAVYFNATYDIPFLPLLLGAVGGAALMQMSGLKSEDNDKGAILISNHTARLLSAVVFPLFFFLFVFREELFTVLLTAKYAESVPIFAVTVFIVPLRAYNFTSILQNRHKGKVINMGALLDAIIAFGLMYPLYQLYGLLGIALSFVISSYIQGAYYLYQTGKILKTSIKELIPLKNWLIKLIVFSTTFISTHYLLSERFNDGNVLLLGGILMVITLLITLVIELRTPTENYGSAVS